MKLSSLSFAFAILPYVCGQGFTDYVDLTIGTDGGGHVFPGPTLPHGLVKVGIDTTNVGEGTAGYTVDGNVTAISHLHVSGTGGGNSYQVISLLPFRGTFPINLSRASMNSRRANEKISVGYMSLELIDFGARVEMSATRHAAIHRYYWNSSSFGKSHAIFNLRHMPSGYYRGSKIGELESIDGNGWRMVGHGSYKDTWSGAYNSPNGYYKIYFCAETDEDVEVQKWGEGKDDHGVIWTFKNPRNSTIVRVGISWISTVKACYNLETELPSSRSLEDVRAAAIDEWEEKLRAIELEGASKDYKTIFYSSLYRTMLMPVDRTGENPKWESKEYFDDFYCIWDTFRSVHPLLTLTHPQTQAAIVRSLIDIQQHDGYMPDSRVANSNGMTQAGSNADVVLADAYVKRLPGINWTAGYAALVKDAEIQPPGKGQWLYEGRGDLDFWKRQGWIPAYKEQERWLHRSAARTVEYSYNDFCVAEVAKGLGRLKDARKYMNRSGSWQNLWKHDLKSHGSKGFIIPKGKNGKWWFGEDNIWADVTVCSPINFRHDRCYLENDEYYESSSWAYSLYVPHDTATLIELSGGERAFLSRLDKFFDLDLFDPGNEPSFLVPFMYNYIGRPDKTANLTRKLLRENYNSGRKGIPGNDDSGAMGSWFIFTTLGFFPVAGQDLYLLASPHFPRTTIHLDPNSPTKTFSLIAHDTSEENIYIQRAVLNGKSLNRNWFRHTEIMNGGLLEVWMGVEPSEWGMTELPPSYSRYGGGPDFRDDWDILSAGSIIVITLGIFASGIFVMFRWRARRGYTEIPEAAS